MCKNIWHVECGVWLVYYEQNTSQLWYNWFKEDREDVNDDACPGRPSTSTTVENIEAVKKIILHNRRITIRVDAADVGISFGSCQVKKYIIFCQMWTFCSLREAIHQKRTELRKTNHGKIIFSKLEQKIYKVRQITFFGRYFKKTTKYFPKFLFWFESTIFPVNNGK